VLVSDLGNAELTELAQTVSLPLVQRLGGVMHNSERETAALPFVLTRNESRE